MQCENSEGLLKSKCHKCVPQINKMPSGQVLELIWAEDGLVENGFGIRHPWFQTQPIPLKLCDLG